LLPVFFAFIHCISGQASEYPNNGRTINRNPQTFKAVSIKITDGSYVKYALSGVYNTSLWIRAKVHKSRTKRRKYGSTLIAQFTSTNSYYSFQFIPYTNWILKCQQRRERTVGKLFRNSKYWWRILRVSWIIRFGLFFQNLWKRGSHFSVRNIVFLFFFYLVFSLVERHLLFFIWSQYVSFSAINKTYFAYFN
jgi:hypothetical protein